MLHSSVIRLVPDDTDRFLRIRRRMLSDAPWAFASALHDDIALDPAHLRDSLADPENAIVAVESPSGPAVLIATAGIFRMDSPKFSHRARLWGVFVDQRHRSRGLGRAVVAAAVDLARRWDGVDFVDLGVSANSPHALALYRSLGFVEWGREPESTQHDGRRYDEIYLTLRIQPPDTD